MRNVIIITVIIFYSLNVFSTDGGLPIIKNFKAETYEGGSRIYSLVCTKDGLLYAGDKNGVLEFDGENWIKINCGFSVTSLAVDSNDVVYVAGNRGIGKLEADSSHAIVYKSLNHFVTTDRSIRKFRFSKVFNIRNKIIYVLGNEIIINTSENIRIIESPHSFTYYQKLNNDLYFYSPDDGVYQLIDNKLRLISNAETLKNQNVVGFIRINEQIHIIISEIGILNIENNLLSPIKTLVSEIQSNEIHGIDQIDDSTFALKTFYNGVIILNSNGEIINRYNYELGLLNNTVFTAFKDYWNNLWVGTASGISVIRLDFPFVKYNDQHGIGTGYSSVFFDDELYLATSQGLYKSRKDSRGVFKMIKLFNGHVWGLHIIDGFLYFGSADGVYSWDNEIIGKVSSYPGGWYIRELPDNKGFFLTGSTLGLSLLKKASNNKLEHLRLISGISANIRNIEVDNEKNIWAEFEKGVLRFNLNNELTEVENLRSFDRVELHNNFKRVFKINDKLYFLADSGIYYNERNDVFIKDTIFNTLMRSNIYPSNIVVDKFKRMWVFSGEKLFCYFLGKEGIQKAHLNFIEFADYKYPTDYESVYSADSQHVIIGQEEGFIGYSLGYKRQGNYSANRVRKVVITSSDGLEKKIKGREEIVNWVQYGNLEKGIKSGNSIKFFFSAGCSQYNSVKYATFLYGFDKEWPDWNNETIKEYTNLPAGEYKFIVRSINKSNEESIPAIYNFNVLPPWYLSWAAKVTYGIILVLIIFFIERSIQYRAKKIKNKLQKKQEEIIFRKEQAQIQENLKKQQEIIKLKNEKLRIDNLYKSKELANSTMGVIKKNQFLTDLKTELEKIKEYAEKNKLVTGDIKDVIRKIDKDIDNEENWKVFEDYFDRVHEKFLNRLRSKYPILTPKDLRLCAYLRMNLSTKEIAPLLNITVRGVEIGRYRLRKKLEIDRNDNLNDFLMKY